MRSSRKWLDYIPLVSLIGFAVISSLKMSSLGYALQWQHYLGYVLLIAAVISFIKHHQVGVLMTLFCILAALFTLVSYSVGLRTNSFYWTPFGIQIPLFWGNAQMLPFLLFHCILSWRYYIGILTKKYWQALLK